jgi:hypothetical protein
MWKDPIVEEIRQFHQAHAAQFDNYPERIAQDWLQLQEQACAEGVKFVSYPPRRPVGWVAPIQAAL